MIVKNSSKENNTVTFQVELDPNEFEKHVNAAYLKNRSRIQVPGFRKGKASRMVVEGFYGKDVFYEDALEDAANEAFAFGVEQESLRTVGRPSLTDTETTEEKGHRSSHERYQKQGRRFLQGPDGKQYSMLCG